jgi:hypothetical protein
MNTQLSSPDAVFPRERVHDSERLVTAEAAGQVEAGTQRCRDADVPHGHHVVPAEVAFAAAGLCAPDPGPAA